MASMPNFEAAYGPKNGVATAPFTEPMFTILPLAIRNKGKTACVTATCPMMFTSN